MYRRTYLAAASAAIAATAGCSTLTGGGSGSDGSDDESDGADVELENTDAGAAGAQTLRVPVEESLAGGTLSVVSATYPRDRFVVDSTSHDAITVGVDTDDDGSLEEEFGADAISGANNNEYSFDVTLETDYELTEGDVVVLDYPAVTNPSESGEYEVTVTLNETQETTVTLVVE
ncbi:hypothetical protein [Halobellus ordinarius]|uniref:hypothetical protein n=1 Tax=Halobellus ordinarius TaxID=3075120 RepID=UPI002880BC46|nr:hypothetical protein [Halobellus sp. ZY16]